MLVRVHKIQNNLFIMFLHKYKKTMHDQGALAELLCTHIEKMYVYVSE